MVAHGKPVAIVTGASSFVGMHLARTFAQRGWRVFAVTTRPLQAYEGIRAARLAVLDPIANIVQCDITDEAQVAALIEQAAPNLWIHHAAQTQNYHAVDYDLAGSLAVNVVPLAAIYKRLAGSGCGVIVTGTSMEYTTGDAPHRESDPCWPDMPYGVSKLMEMVEANRLALRYGVPTRGARLFIPIGAFDTPGRLMDTVIAKLMKGEAVDLTSGEQVKDFVSVEDVCAGYVALADDFARTAFDLFNICSGTPVKVKDVLKELCTIIGADEALLRFGRIPNRPHEPRVLCGDNAKARAVLNWSPRPLRATLEALVAQAQTGAV